MNQPTHNTTVVVGGAVAPQKSMGTALLLAFFFGPLGLLYASVAGGIIMLVVTIILMIFTLGLSLFITWPVCVIWAAIAVNKYREEQAHLAQQTTHDTITTSVPADTADPDTEPPA